MSVTADSGKRPLQDVTATSSSSATPGESPLKSLSATSLSSIDSEGGVSAEKLATTLIEIQKKRETPKEQYGKLVDTYGNEFQVPNFTIKQIRDAIPAHCFDRSAARSLMVVGRDILFLAIVFIVFRILVTPENIPSKIIRTALWLIGYTVIQGCIATGLWVMAHECGHQAFSSSKMLNDTVGFVCHSMLLVPYFSWKISHSKHHKSTGHMDRDMVFVPKTRDEYASRVGKLAHELTELGEEAPIVTLVSMIGQQLLGWPLYLLINVTGHNNHGRQSEGRGLGKTNGWYGGVNHFNPKSPLYGAKDMSKILYSDLGIIVVGGALYLIGQNFGWANLAVWYGIPYLWVNFWLVAITYLQHTDPTLPHYDGSMWNFHRGAAATVDRDLGFIGRYLMHGIVETHVLHHFVSTIPFYHADEASEAIKPILGMHYRSSVEDGFWGFLKALYTNSRICQWVEPAETAEGLGKGVLFFRNRNHLGLPPMEMDAKQTEISEPQTSGGF